MGFFDDIQASMNRGMASAGRAVDTQKIKMQMNDAAGASGPAWCKPL